MSVKIYLGCFKEFHDCKYDKKSIFAIGSEKLTHKLRLVWNSLWWLKETSSKIVQLCLNMLTWANSLMAKSITRTFLNVKIKSERSKIRFY